MSKKVIISGGGTGGHIFPAIAIANALKEIDSNIEILFVGAEGRMEMEKVPNAGYKIVGLPVMGLPRKFSFKIFKVLINLMKSMKQARKIIKDFQPNVVVGVGGYASGPVLKVAAKNKIPCLIQEQNSFPGVTNRLLAKKVDLICVAYEGLEKFFPKDKIIKTGNPVRQDILETKNKRKEAIEFFGLNENLPIVLSLGGSLGALTINESIYNNRKFFAENNIQILWQTGKSYFTKAKESLEGVEKFVFPHEFIFKMDLAFAAADIVISRAGASTISELCLVGKPAIFVPSPNVSEDHQTHNAMALVNKNAALIVKDAEANEKLMSEIQKLVADNEKQKDLIENIKNLALPNSAKIIAEKVLGLINE
ncbi:MAG: undecaprenyldiphospho-muramoylpentapeptide beta-N-acetylglucosaminyltransferase [Bacteroidales bacterium]|nr:undecaprenyldiphospho-muramoylpentapeptide beta-N-acetylglucosaminyltransferase [Bacteroidales bacterium]